MKIQQVPVLFLPKRNPDEKNSIVKSPNKKNKSNNGRINEQKKNDAEKFSYLLRTNQKRETPQRISRIC